jgi:hypothetical protein
MDGNDFLTETELSQTLQVGAKTKALLLSLIQLKRIHSERKGEDTVFHITC